MRRVIFGLTILLVAGIAVCVSGIGFGVRGSEERRGIYLTAQVERGDVTTTLSATGTLRALETVEVGSQLSGQVAEVLVDFNDKVKEGEPLARLEPRTFVSEVREAEAGLEVARAEVMKQRATLRLSAAEVASARHSLTIAQARIESGRAKLTQTERDLQRKRSLGGSQVLAEADVDQAMSAHRSAVADLRVAEAEAEIAYEAVAAAEARRVMADANLLHAEAAERQKAAELDQARIDLARSVITAPIDGVVVGRDVDGGQTVTASLEAPTLFMLAGDLRRMVVHANVDEADIGQVEVGQPATFTVDAYPDRAFTGKVTQIRKEPQLIQNVVTYTVLIATQNTDLALLPGMTAVVRITVDEAKQVLKVPNTALHFDPRGTIGASKAAPGEASGTVVWIPGQDGAALPVRVTAGSSNDSETEILEGPLRAGQPVIVGMAPTPQNDMSFGFSWRL